VWLRVGEQLLRRSCSLLSDYRANKNNKRTSISVYSEHLPPGSWKEGNNKNFSFNYYLLYHLQVNTIDGILELTKGGYLDMAEVKSVKLRGGFTVNMGNYESAVIQAEVELEVQDGESTDEVFQQARDLIDKEVGIQMKSLKKLEKVKNNATGKILDVVRSDD